ncbi:DUF2490 domain-containing protein [Niabella drilacis]|uniref:DUF2490 domain-containing protein n=1 Tax=Niabella drilacis (strain DSM 25811 / CCM 8410 / CCUG 62505 / LMG 26954 / E90) TaxID=1285928 RepID=A0A1G6JR27_NIADE|nr:DUF2490 domain-containing protein [Niabella drilacis]SDC21174.1 Protein of unknown function [Niabella drilacis]
MIARVSIFLFFFIIPAAAVCQTRSEQTGWAAWFHNTRLDRKWGLYSDIQVRTRDNWNGVRNILVRPGISYYIRPNQTATLGYLYAPTFPAPDITNGRTLTEHRIWEQYTVIHPLLSGALSHRFRLEQRFIERPGSDIFSQRLRYFFRGIQPLIRNENGFKKGPFAALQNELFFNLQNKDKLNGSFFDQNRAYIALGYRASPKFDIEAGYLNQAVKGPTVNTMNNAIQLAAYTRF